MVCNCSCHLSKTTVTTEFAMQGLSKAIQHHQNQTAKLASLQASLASLQQQYASLQDQCIDSRKQHHHLQKQHTAWQDQCSESQQKHHQLQEQYQACQGQLRTTAQELERSRSQVEQLRQAMSTKQSKQLSLQADSSLILQSGNASMQHQVTRYQCMPIWAPSGERKTVQSTYSCTDTDSHSELVKATAIRDAAAQLAVGTGDVDALTALPVTELHRLESTCQAVLGNVVAVSRCKALAEVTRLRAQVDQLERSAEDSRSCSLCMEADKDVVLNCGHQMCQSCSKTLTQCPFCSAVISACIHVF